MSELKAKRTHARRSCDLCKVRKTRCELPDLNVASSSEPLPADKSCHRCRVLALPCIVDDHTRKGRKRAHEGDGLGDVTPPSRRASKSARKPKSNGTPVRTTGGVAGARAGGGSEINHEMDLMHAFHPAQEYGDDDYPEETGGRHSNLSQGHGQRSHQHQAPPYDPFIHSSQGAGGEASSSRRQSAAAASGSSEEVQEMQGKGVKLHGRAMELVCAMLRVAYGKTKMFTGRRASEEVDLAALMTPELLSRLELGLTQLKTFHPYLDPFRTQCKGNERTSTPDKLLFATVIYLCTLPLPIDRSIADLRATLAPFIERLRDEVLLAPDVAFPTVSALELLAMHAPFGILPLQSGNPRKLSMARGQMITARATSDKLSFHNLARAMVMVTARYVHFEEPDYWLWACLSLQECTVGLECESMERPKYIADIVTHLEKYLEPSHEPHWVAALEKTDVPSLIGRLSVIDRACRFGEVFDRLDRLRAVLETAAQDVDFDPVGAMVEEMTSFGVRIEQLDQKHDHLMSLLAPSARGAEVGWLGYRALSRRAVMNKVQMIGMRYIIAAAYLPGRANSFPNPISANSALNTKIYHALNKATQSADIMAFLRRSDAGVQAVWNFGVHRGNIAEQSLGAFVDLEPILLPGPVGSGITSHLMPLHEVIAIVTECAKYLMEVEGAATLMRRSAKTANRPFKPPTWVYTMQQACGLLNRLGGLSERVEGAESIANGCSNVLGSMLRITHEWMKSSASGTPSGSVDEGQPQTLLEGQTGQAIAAAFSTDGSGAGMPPPSLADAIRSLPPPEHHQHPPSEDPHHAAMHNQQMLHAQVQQYMDTSDRWMAGDHSQPPPPLHGSQSHIMPSHESHPHPHPHGGYDQSPYKSPVQYGQQHVMPHQHGQATNLDLLLSHMFNYGGSAGAPHPQRPRPMKNIPQGLGADNEQFNSETGSWSHVYDTQ